MGIKETIQKNLPHILTGISMVGTGIAVGTGIYAGYKIKEELDELDEDVETIEKVKVVVKNAAVPVAAACVAAGCAYASDKENATRYAALAGTLAVATSENEYLTTFKKKAEEKLGKKKTDEVKDEARKDFTANTPPMGTLARFKDLEFGYEFWSTKENFIQAVEIFNDSFNNMSPDMQQEGLPMSRFYEILLGGRYEHIPKHDDYGLQYDGILSFRPLGKNLRGRIFEDGTLGYEFEYETSALNPPDLWIS